LNDQPALPDPRPLQFNMPQPSAGRNQTGPSLAYKVQVIRELIATVASKASRRPPVQHRFRGQRNLAEAVMLAAVAPVVAMVVKSGINFYSYDF
jgi:hypothetical protein